MMSFTHINGREGPYWAAYQEYRRINEVTADPAYVPEWFMVGLMRDRLSAARVAIEQLDPLDKEADSSKIIDALKVLGLYLSEGANQVGQREALLLGLLGAQEAEIAEEREWARRRAEEPWRV